MIKQLSQALLRFKWLCIMLSFLAMVGLSAGITKLGFTNAYDAQFSADNPQFNAYKQLIADYDQIDNLLIAIAPESGNVFTSSHLNVVATLTDLAWQTPHSSRVDSISNYLYTYGIGEDIVSEPMFERPDQLTAEEIQTRARHALNEPSLRNALVSDKGHVTGINITIDLPRENLQAEVSEVMTYINGIIDQLKIRHPDISFYLAGKIAQDQAFFDASGADSATLFPLLIVVIFVVVFIILRSMVAGLALLFMVVGCTSATLGIFGWKHILLTPETLSAAIMIMPLAIADCVHLFLAYSKAKAAGAQKYDAVLNSMISNFKPILLTSITTAIGFLSLTFAEAPPFQLMGYMVAMGVILAFILSFTLFAPLLLVLPIRQRNSHIGPRLASWITELTVQKSNLLLSVLACLTIIIALGISRNELNQNTAEYFTPKMEYRQDIEWIDQQLTGINNIQFSVPAAKELGVTEYEYLSTLDAFSEWLRQQEGVRNVVSFSDVMKKLNRVMNDNNPDFYRLEEDSLISAQYLTLYQLSLPYGMGITNLINFDKSASRLSISLNISSNQDIIEFDKKARAWLTHNAPEYMQAYGTSADIMYAYQLDYNIPGIVTGLIISILLIAIIMMFALRSVRLGLISLIPNVVPIAIAFGIWGYVDGQVGLAIAIVMGMTLGIVVDDTVHLISKYQRAITEFGLSGKHAIQHALESVTSALLATTSAIAAGFLVLTFSLFSPNADLGILTAMIVIIALIFDLIFLPSLLLKTDKQHA